MTKKTLIFLFSLETTSYSIFSRYALKKYSSLTVTFYTFVFSSISIFPFCHFSTMLSLFSPKTALLAAGLSLFCTTLPYILYTFGLKGLETGKAAIFVTIEPLVGTLIGFFLWHEEVSFIKITGILLIFISIILCSKSEKNN